MSLTATGGAGFKRGAIPEPNESQNIGNGPTIRPPLYIPTKRDVGRNSNAGAVLASHEEFKSGEKE
eukprot:CAMPEP_0202980286 /NCGR_PEP_ID=MMETSP1396-20130829/86245_1 /ASSEMBLY_ACC=CAM_ASM_000872 /TAXON_ID= /ORGANISM="Pseudokeronopsis sp., Strain Brazil" /LENGTH=65 /DNA_ID=CAMNT_0049720175 /DNA_START=720 /DNA_END=917 /DNA_ORIENTATION=-